jgi:antitoxin PrlF
MRVTQKGRVTIPLEIRRALGIGPGSEVEFELDEEVARLRVDADLAAAEISRMRDPRRVAAYIPGATLIAP